MGMTGPEGDDEETKLVILHHNPQYADDCMEILNSQWPRSKGLRLRSLRSSCDQFPTSLALLRRLDNDRENFEVIGHSRVNVLPREENSIWIESVIIRSDLRGKGYGRVLMTRTEVFSRECGFTTAYLSTHDQQHFYSKLGYDFCPPVCIFGGSVNRNIIPKQFLLPPIPQDEKLGGAKANELCKVLSNQCSLSDKKTVPSDPSGNEQGRNIGPPPPPAPPLPPKLGPSLPVSKIKKNDIKKLDLSNGTKMYMKKSLIL